MKSVFLDHKGKLRSEVMGNTKRLARPQIQMLGVKVSMQVNHIQLHVSWEIRTVAVE